MTKDPTSRHKLGVAVPDALAAAQRASARLAPTWPLDRFIAVNPLWGFIDRPLPEVAARVGALSGARLTMPRAWYAAQHDAGVFDAGHVQAALAQTGSAMSVADVLGAMRSPAPVARRWARVTDVLDAGRDLTRHSPWTAWVVDQISRHCAATFDRGQATASMDGSAGLYATWQATTSQDRSAGLLMGLRGVRQRVADLPATAEAVLGNGLVALGVAPDQWEAYLTALLLDVQGWASWCAWRRFMATQQGRQDDTITELLAVRLAWEWVLYDLGGDAVADGWRQAMALWPACEPALRRDQAVDWVLQTALDLAHHEGIARGLLQGLDATRPEAPTAQVAFCIDVRSEVYRRALEAQDARVQTLGFAGFFGLPTAYRPVGATEARPQLPGPLAPRLLTGDTGIGPDVAVRRAARMTSWSAWKRFKHTALSGFSFVETMGLGFGPKLVTDALGVTRPVTHPERIGLTSAEHAARKPRLVSTVQGDALDLTARVDLAEGILRAMSLTRDLARLVVLVGHGSQTVNNPHAAGLDCGACCGQSGEVNARAVAGLLNDPDVRAALPARGVDVPDTTWFVPGLHDTTTDTVTLFDRDEVPATHAADLVQIESWLARASEAARAERAPRLGLDGLTGPALRAALERRARDWAQVRPEWGLARNTSFVVAPRERCRHLDLGGRTFLHDYRWAQDRDFATLELILTAPMVVTHWINFQYYASTVDNRRYGSGNKVLHNVVGGGVGLLEGNGGDLRTGLAMQSLHDGTDWVHEPVRLGVFVEAPAEAIAAVIRKHALVRDLVENGWVSLHQVDAEAGVVRRWRDGDWAACESAIG